LNTILDIKADLGVGWKGQSYIHVQKSVKITWSASIVSDSYGYQILTRLNRTWDRYWMSTDLDTGCVTLKTSQVHVGWLVFYI